MKTRYVAWANGELHAQLHVYTAFTHLHTYLLVSRGKQDLIQHNCGNNKAWLKIRLPSLAERLLPLYLLFLSNKLSISYNLHRYTKQQCMDIISSSIIYCFSVLVTVVVG